LTDAVSVTEIIPGVESFKHVVSLMTLELNQLAIVGVIAVIPTMSTASLDVTSIYLFRSVSLPAFEPSLAIVVVVAITLAGFTFSTPNTIIAP
jgi:fluoride ion exporter CrcB/FEX